MTQEGRLVFRIVWDGERIVRVTIETTRLLHAQRLLEGKPAERLPVIVPLLFSLCGRAQAAAAGAAVEAARGQQPDARTRATRNFSVAAEWAQEQLWRLLLDLPRFLGENPHTESLARARHALDRVTDRGGKAFAREGAAALRTTLSTQVFGMPCGDWLAASSAELRRWMDRRETAAARLLQREWKVQPETPRCTLLPPLDREALRRQIAPHIADDPHFCAQPQWKGAVAETGALARQSAHPLVVAAVAEGIDGCAVRLLARLVDLAQVVLRLERLAQDEIQPTVTAVALAPQEGLAAIETARGTLLHYVQLAGHTVSRYRIVAPTEWNFHPEGAFVLGLLGRPAASLEAVRRAAALLAHTLDPCVAHEVEVTHA